MENNKPSQKPWWQDGLNLFLRLSSWVVVPVVAAVFVGKYLDRKFHSDPWLFLFSVAVAFVVSITMIVRTGLREMSKTEKENGDIKNTGE